MAKKILAVVLAICAAVVAKVATQQVIGWLRGEPAAASGAASAAASPAPGEAAVRPWVEQALVPGEVVLDVPWPLEETPLELPPGLAKMVTRMVTQGHEQDGLSLMTSLVSYVPGTPTSLDGAADGALGNMKAVKGIHNFESSKRETTALGVRAIELQARADRNGGGPLRIQGLVFFHGADLVQILAITPEGQSDGVALWERIRDSIRAAKAP